MNRHERDRMRTALAIRLWSPVYFMVLCLLAVAAVGFKPPLMLALLAAGTGMLDSTGLTILQDDGTERLADGTDDDCCCPGAGCGCTAQYDLTFSGVLTCHGTGNCLNPWSCNDLGAVYLYVTGDFTNATYRLSQIDDSPCTYQLQTTCSIVIASGGGAQAPCSTTDPGIFTTTYDVVITLTLVGTVYEVTVDLTGLDFPDENPRIFRASGSYSDDCDLADLNNDQELGDCGDGVSPIPDKCALGYGGTVSIDPV